MNLLDDSGFVLEFSYSDTGYKFLRLRRAEAVRSMLKLCLKYFVFESRIS